MTDPPTESAAGRAPAPAVVPFGDAAVLVVLDGPVGLATSRRVHLAAARIRILVAGRAGWGRPIPGATSVLVPVDPLEPGVTAAVAMLEVGITPEPVDSTDGDGPGWDDPVTHEIPVRYGGADGPDLEEAAELAGLSAAGVVELHARTPWRALFLGFAPGFAYLGTAPRALIVPRRAEPRVRVPAGSVAIAGELSAVYPIDSPGGWQLIGRTAVTLWDPRGDPPARILAGDLVRFVPDRG